MWWCNCPLFPCGLLSPSPTSGIWAKGRKGNHLFCYSPARESTVPTLFLCPCAKIFPCTFLAANTQAASHRQTLWIWQGGKAQYTFPSPLVNKCPSGNKPFSFLPGEKCLLAFLTGVFLYTGASTVSLLTIQTEDSRGQGQRLMGPLHHEP